MVEGSGASKGAPRRQNVRRRALIINELANILDMRNNIFTESFIIKDDGDLEDNRS